MWSKKIAFITVLTLGIPFWGNAQFNDESGYWLTAGVTKDLPKKFDLNSSISCRFGDGISYLDIVNFALGIDRKINKKLKLGVGYRYSYRFTTYQNRFWLEAKYGKEIIKRTDLDIRARLQTDLLLDSYQPQNTLRTRLQASHKIKKTKIYPYIFGELFCSVNRFQSGNISSRIGGGIDFKQLKNQTLGIGYFKIVGLTNEKSKNRNIFTLDYKFNF